MLLTGVLEMWARSAYLQTRAVASIRTLHGMVAYADDMPFQEPYAVVRWLEGKLGHDSTSAVAQVSLAGTSVSDQDLNCLANLNGLRTLLLQNTAVGDAALEAVAAHRGLEELSLRSTKVTDAGLTHLAQLKRLEFLYLHDTDITDAGLVHLEGLTSLKRVELNRTRVTPAGVRRLNRALPDLWISY